ncbi:MAG: hypothetical protein IKE10_01220 [Bacilli bacterium]|nr:hypothetical protein [Bacilli bacterium]
MKKVKSGLWKTIELVYKHKFISFFVAIGIATSLILFNVLANDDEFANKLVVKNAAITSIEDGGLYEFDSTTGNGKDSAGDNGIVRNFDSITYRASYNLELKEADPEVTQVEGRNVIVDVILPNTIKASLGSSNSQSDEFISPVALDANNDYYEFVLDNVTTTSSEPNIFDFILYNANTKVVDASFTPIILIKEATDENYKAISEMSDSEKESFISNLTNNRVACDPNTIECSTTFTGIYDYDVTLYQGVYFNSTNTNLNKNYPIGIEIKIPRNGLGIYIPNTVSFDVAYATTDTDITVSYVADSFVNYKDPNKNYAIYYTEATGELVDIPNVVSYDSGVITVGNLKAGSSVIGTAAFEINSVRDSATTDSSITVTVSNLKANDTLVKQTGDEIVVTDYAHKMVGAFNASVDIVKGQAEGYETAGNVFLNYGEQFAIVEQVEYATNGVGDTLDELHNYIKIDSDAFIVSREGNSVSEPTAIMRYGYGEWNSNYFELTGESGCPTNISSLTKENLMNLFGGPCLRAKNTVKWNEDENTTLPLIIVDTVFGDASDETLNFNEGTIATVTLNATVRNNASLRNTSHQVVSSSVGTFNGNKFYMSSAINDNNVSAAKNKDSYIKTVYDFNNKLISRDYSNLCHAAKCAINGNTIHVIAYTVNQPEVHAYHNDIERTVFYDYPIEWRIDANATTSDDSIVFDKATVVVAIPKKLNYLYAETMVDGKRVNKTGTKVEGSSYDTYTYVFNQNEINNNMINTLSIFTDIYLDTKSGTQTGIIVTVDFEGSKIDGTNIIRLSDPRDDAYKYNSNIVTLYNGSSITTYSNVDHRYIETNSPYVFTMKSYNNSSIGEGTGYSYSGAALYYVLPYIEDSNYRIYDKTFTNSKFKIKLLSALNAGYTAYYTTDDGKNVSSDIYNSTNSDTTTVWKPWNNPSDELEGATAIKIVKNDNWNIDTYFLNENGVVVSVTPINNEQADAYYNGFTVTVNRPDNYIEACVGDPEDCSTTPSAKLYYQSSKSLVEVYSRKISGFVFEDYNYSNMYEGGEDQLQDIVVELYKLNNSEYTNESDSKNPNAYVNPEVDELIATKSTSSTGAYSFAGLKAGYYYVLYRYDGAKYTPSDKYGGEATGVTNANAINSKAVALNGVDDAAVSDIITLSESSSANERYINLGLRIRKEFAVEINKYITKIVQTSNQGTKTYEYDKATKVNIDIKNLKNTKFRVTYSFDISNTKYFPGYIGVIMDLMPEGATFDNTLEENGDWVLMDNILYYKGLQNILLLPGEKHYFNLVLDIDTNKGGTYVNIVAAQLPSLMGDDVVPFNPGDVSMGVGDNESGGFGATDDDVGGTTNTGEGD